MGDESISVRDATGGTQSIAVDTVSGAQYQRVKLDGGGDGASVSITAGQTTASASLPVVLATDGTLIPGTSASALGKAEDAAHSSGDVGVMALGVRKDTAVALANDGDYHPVIVDSVGRLHVVQSGGTAGDVAHGTVDSGQPVKIGGRGRTTAGGAADNGDRVDQWFGVYGTPVMGAYPDPAADGTPNATAAYLLGPNGETLELLTRPMLFNGTTWDRQRNNTEGTALASAARTTSTSSAVLTNYNHRGIVAVLDVTANPGGAQTLQLILRAQIAGGTQPYWLSATATSALSGGAGEFVLSTHPGSLNADAAAFSATFVASSLPLPRQFFFTVSHSGAGSWTYSLAYCLI